MNQELLINLSQTCVTLACQAFLIACILDNTAIVNSKVFNFIIIVLNFIAICTTAAAVLFIIWND